MVPNEQVLVVPTSVFHEIGHFQGFCADANRYLDVLLDPAHVSYRLRAEMEEDPSFKQLIPYVIFRHRQGDSTRLFHYTRGKGQGEGRLHAKRSIGIGGHISHEDAALDGNPYQEGMRRELAEEVDIRTAFQQRCAGLINDDETPVGRVHLGIVHLFDVETPDVFPREQDIIDTGFANVSDLLADKARFETWSQICLAALFG